MTDPFIPNFNEKRTIDRCKRALGFACGVMSPTKSHSWSSRYIDKYFGISSNPLSKYLKKELLIVTDDFYRFNSAQNKCKEYILNQSGVDSLRENLKLAQYITYPSVLQLI